MRCFVNDASLQGQFSSASEFSAALRELMTARAKHARLRDMLRVARSLSQQPVTQTLTFRAAISHSPDRDFKQLVLRWLTQNGPFWDDERSEEAEDYFECFSLDVTDQGLGEAARRVRTGENANSFSFQGGHVVFAVTPLSVDHGLKEDRLGRYEIANHWTAQSLGELAQRHRAEPTSWIELFEEARVRYPLLLLPETLQRDARLVAEPFTAAIAKQALSLMGHLQDYMESRSADGTDSTRSSELIRQFFTKAGGAEPVFSDESTTNKRDFQDALTFPDAANASSAVAATWHGKIRHRFFRLHFVWPVPRAARTMQVCYLGPKLTKL